MGRKRDSRGGRPGGRPQSSKGGAEGKKAAPKAPPPRGAKGPAAAAQRRHKPLPPVADPVTPERLGTMLSRNGFTLSKVQLTQLATYHSFLLDRNRQLNLTRILNLEDMVLKHYVDCFLVARHLPDLPEPLLDIGSGAGFPGIPLKILYPDLHIILGDGVRKRVNFLREAREEVGLEKLDIIGRNIDRDFEYPVNGIITRAVETIRDTLKRSANCLLPGGLAIFMKGPNVDEEIVEAQKKFPELFKLEEDIAYALPNSPYRRRLVVFRKLPREE